MSTEEVCCGQGGAWATAGAALVVGCMLCPPVLDHWRRPENRADGRPYEPPLDGRPSTETDID
jgi:hypothetical protein